MHFKERNTAKSVFVPLWKGVYHFTPGKGSTLKEKNIFPLGANSFHLECTQMGPDSVLLEYTPFQKGTN